MTLLIACLLALLLAPLSYAQEQDRSGELERADVAREIKKYLREGFGEPGYETTWYPNIKDVSVRGVAVFTRTDLENADDPKAGKICSAVSGFVFDRTRTALKLNRVQILGPGGQVLIDRNGVGELCRAKDDAPAFFNPAGEVTGKYDRFEEKTKVSLSNALVAGEHLDGLYLMAYAERPNGAATPSTLILGFKAITPFVGAYFPAAPKLDALIDGRPAHFGPLIRVHNQDVLGVLNVEAYGVAIAPDVILRLVNAKVVEMRLSSTEFKLTERHRDLLREFQKRIHW